jgi:hypothetical protein
VPVPDVVRAVPGVRHLAHDVADTAWFDADAEVMSPTAGVRA